MPLLRFWTRAGEKRDLGAQLLPHTPSLLKELTGALFFLPTFLP